MITVIANGFTAIFIGLFTIITMIMMFTMKRPKLYRKIWDVEHLPDEEAKRTYDAMRGMLPLMLITTLWFAFMSFMCWCNL
jgi:hypothetical protein